MAEDRVITINPEVSENNFEKKDVSGVFSLSTKKIVETSSDKPIGKGDVDDFNTFEKKILSYDKFISPIFENYDENESIILGVPIISAAIEKTVDFVVGDGYSAVGGNVAVIEEFMREQDFDTFLRTVTRHLSLYGNCFVEIVSLGEEVRNLKILSPKTMRVRRNKKGKILGYVQVNEKDPTAAPISFKPDQMAHFKVNVVGNKAYGTSIIHPMRGVLKKTLKMEENTSIVVDRKTNAPMHVKLGNEEYPASSGDVDNFKTDLQRMKANHEWVTGHAVEMNVIGFQGKILDVGPWSKYLTNQLVFGTQVPLFLLGIPEGSNRSTATQQMEAFYKRRQSIQLSLSSTIEQVIFSRIVSSKTQLVWGSGKDTRLDEIKSLSRLLDSRLVIPLSVREAASKKLSVLLNLDLDEVVFTEKDLKFNDLNNDKENDPEPEKKDVKDQDGEKKKDIERLNDWFERAGD